MVPMFRLMQVIALSLLMCGHAAAGDCPPASGGTDNRLLLATKTELSSLEPYAANDNATLGVLGNVYEGLVRRNANGSIGASLAERWELVEPTRWRFYLRQNVKFHDGRDFTADDVVYSAQRVREKVSDLRSILPPNAKVMKVDAHTVDVVLEAETRDLIAEWSSWYIVSKPWIEQSEPIRLD